jgi:hypothetical protein
MKRERILFLCVLAGACFILFAGLDPCEAG